MTAPLPEPPAEVMETARARATARAVRDWSRADALKAEIQAAGWKVVDRGVDFRLEPAAPPTVEEGGIVRYGAAAAVPSVLAEPPSSAFTLLVVAEDEPEELATLLAALRAHAPAGTHVLVVANDPSPRQAAALAAGDDLAPIAGAPPEVVQTSTRLGRAAARNVGLRRARGAVVVLADAAAEPTGDALTPLAAALAGPDVAVAGAVGFVTADLRRYEETAGPEVDVVGLGWLACRRADLAALGQPGSSGPLDEKLVSDDHLGAWWSLALREGSDPAAAPRRAVRLDLPVRLPPPRPPEGPAAGRLAKRAHYRVLDRFRDRPGLRSGSG